MRPKNMGMADLELEKFREKIEELSLDDTEPLQSPTPKDPHDHFIFCKLKNLKKHEFHFLQA